MAHCVWHLEILLNILKRRLDVVCFYLLFWEILSLAIFIVIVVLKFGCMLPK